MKYNNESNEKELRVWGYISAADKAIRLTGNREARKGWSAKHDIALRATLARLHQQLMDGTLPMPKSAEEFVKTAKTHFMGDIKVQWATKDPCCGYLAPGQHQKGPLSLRAAAALRRERGLPADYPLTEAWLADDVKKARYCSSLSLDVGGDNDGRQDDVDDEACATSLSRIEQEYELELEAEGKPPYLKWIRVVVMSLPIDSTESRLARRFVESWEVAEGGKNGDKDLTASGEALGLSKKQLETAKKKLGAALAAAPQASSMVARVKKCGGRGAKLLK